MKIYLLYFVLALANTCIGQKQLSVEYIMQDPKWIGTSPSSPYWSIDSKMLFFNWNPQSAQSDSVYFIIPKDLVPKQTTFDIRNTVVSNAGVTFNRGKTKYAFIKNGDVYVGDVASGSQKRVTHTVDIETNPAFIANDARLTYRISQNVYAWDVTTGTTSQLINFQKGAAPLKEPKKDSLNQQESWLKNDQLTTMEVLASRKRKKDSTEAALKALPKDQEIKAIYLGDKNVLGVVVSPTGRFITYRLAKAAANAKNTIIPNYVTETGYTQDINGRTKVGAPEGSSEFYVFDTKTDTVFLVKTDSLSGIKDLPDYTRDYPKYDSLRKKPLVRKVSVFGPYWNDDESAAVVEVFSEDHKDRWIVLLDAAHGALKVLDRQRDEAWIGGPAIGMFSGSAAAARWIDNEHYWFQSEASGYSHIYTVNVNSSVKRQLTTGNFEIQEAQLSANKKFFYFTSNEVHPGEKHFYRLPVTGGAATRLTSLTGANQVTLSPDEKYLAVLYSYSNKPWELYLQENKVGAKAVQVTNLAQSLAFKSYPWRDPEIVNFKAEDGANVYARLYKPAIAAPGKPAVIFVHGAGYLQNAHKWWSSYFREYMFHNLLADKGYTVLDIDYRGSAGYGRDWRTGIYRFMGGKDLSDHIDGAKYLVEQQGVNPKNIGIYGGSYGGFITLMAMFTKPGVFAAGAGLRSVTDWAHYNDGYTSNILNEPYNDSLPYRRSSPIYYAEGLKGRLLMCHGMVDVNVHFQDIVRLSQRLIELKKENWELAVYPVEDHGFVEPSSWTDEYKRILKLFEETLKQ